VDELSHYFGNQITPQNVQDLLASSTTCQINFVL
jgi:hypothetical protein